MNIKRISEYVLTTMSAENINIAILDIRGGNFNNSFATRQQMAPVVK